MTTKNIQYEQIELIAKKHDVGFERTQIPVDNGQSMVDTPAVRLSGFLANIESSVAEIKAISGDGRYYVEQADDGVYLYV